MTKEMSQKAKIQNVSIEAASNAASDFGSTLVGDTSPEQESDEDFTKRLFEYTKQQLLNPTQAVHLGN